MSESESESDENPEPVRAEFLRGLRVFLPVTLHDLRGRLNNLSLKVELQIAKGADPSWAAPLRDGLRELAEELSCGFSPLLPHDRSRFDLVAVARETHALIEPWARRAGLEVGQRYSGAVPIVVAGDGESVRAAVIAALARGVETLSRGDAIAIAVDGGPSPALVLDGLAPPGSSGAEDAEEATWRAAGGRPSRADGRLSIAFEREPREGA